MTNGDEEIIRDVVGYEGIYTIDIYGHVINVSNNKEVTQWTDINGYRKVNLSKNKKQRGYMVHRLVAEAFIPNPLNKSQVNHIDGNKQHNVVWNLEWNTPSENVRHSVATGLQKNCIPVKVVETGEIFKSISECAESTHGDIGNIYKCLQGERKTCNGYHYEKG